MTRDQNLQKRIDNIEKKFRLGNKNPRLRFPLPDGSFIEMPSHLTVFDIIALSETDADRELDEIERN